MKNIKRKKKKNKQLRNIIIVLILLAITCFILTIAPNYKRKNKTGITLILNNKEVTKTLENEIFVENEDTVYMGMQDVKNLIDENLYYDEEEKQIITSSNMHVAYIKQESNEIELNDVVINIEYQLKEKENTVYLPISELETVYNIKIDYLEEENTVIIDLLSNEKNKANANKNISIYYEPTIFSKKVDTVKRGNSVVIVEQVDEKWTKVMTDNGKIGYTKNKNLSSIFSVRENMENESISVEEYNLEEINVADLDKLDSVETRKEWIDEAVENIVLDDKDGICFDFGEITEYKEEYLRLLIETAPRLREIGKKTAVINNTVIDDEQIIKIVDGIE